MKREAAAGRNPRDIKVLLAPGDREPLPFAGAAEQARTSSWRVSVPARCRTRCRSHVVADGAEGLGVASVLKQAGLAPSTSEAVRTSSRVACGSTVPRWQIAPCA